MRLRPASNGTIQVISTNPALTWTAVSNNSWLTVTQGVSGTGNGSFQYSAAGNPTAAAQTGTITVTPANGTGATLTVIQAGGTLTISPTKATANPAGDTGTVSISTDDAALQWTATKTQGLDHDHGGSFGDRHWVSPMDCRREHERTRSAPGPSPLPRLEAQLKCSPSIRQVNHRNDHA